MAIHPRSTLYPEPYVFGTFIVQYYLHFKLSIGGTSFATYDSVATMGAQMTSAPYPTSGPWTSTWQNNTGAGQLVGIDAWASLALNSGSIDWNWTPLVNGTPPYASCNRAVDGSELFGPNPALGQGCPPCHGGTANSVDTRTGNEHWALPGVAIAGRGPGLDFQTAFNSRDAAYVGMMGHGWRNTYDMALSSNPDGSRTVFQETGSTVPFTKNASGTWEAPARFDAALTPLADGKWKFTRQRSEFFTFGPDGRLLSIADRNGYQTQLVYASGQLDYVEDSAGRRLDFTVNSQGRVTKITDPLTTSPGPRSINFTYNAAADLTGYSDIGGGAWAMTYNADHRVTTVRSPRFASTNKVWEFHYDTQGRVDWEEDPQDRRTELHYDDPAAGATRVVEPDGDARVDWYNDQGLRTKVTIAHGTAKAADTQFTYKPGTQMITSIVDGRGKDWRTEYNDTANPLLPTKTIDPINRVRTMAYNNAGQLTSLTDAEQVTSTWEYDANGNLEKHTTASGTSAAAVTDPVHGDLNHPDDITKVIDPRGKEWDSTFDAAGNQTALADPLNNKTTWAYNNIGWVISSVAPAGNATGASPDNYRTSLQYDAYGALLREIDPANKPAVMEYDPDGNLTTATDREGNVTRLTWTDAGQLNTETTGFGTPAARTITYTHATDGRLTSWGATAASTWVNEWDAAGHLKNQTDPNGKVTQYTYDDAGNLTRLTQPGGDCSTFSRCVRFDRDDAGQLVGMDYSDPDTPDVTLTYDGNGHRLTQNVTGQGTSSWVWTKPGQLASHTDGSGQTVAYTWDKTGNLKDLTYPGQTTPVSYTYDDAGRMSGVTDWTGNHTAFDYDRNDDLTKATYSATTGLVDNWTYDNTDRLDTLTWEDPGSAALGSIDYGRNSNGDVTSATTTGVPGAQTNFTYDARNQLKTTNAGAYTYSDPGYLTRSPAGFNTYDPAGELQTTARAITVVGTAKSNDVLGLSTTLAVTLPSAIQASDQILLVATQQATSAAPDAPSGYTLVGQAQQADGARVTAFRRTATGNETTATVTLGGGSTKNLMAVVYRGVDGTNPIQAFSAASANNATSLQLPSVDAPAIGTQLVAAVGGYNNLLPVTVQQPGGMTSEVAVGDQVLTTGAVGDQTLATSGATGAKTATFSAATNVAGLLIALNPQQTTYQYDDNGSRTRTTAPQATTNYTYDQAGRLTSVGALSGYRYDGDGLRVQAPINGKSTHFTWARVGTPLLLTETPVDANGNPSNAKATSYIYGPGGRVLTRIDPRPDLSLVGTRSISDAGLFVPNLAVPLPAGIQAKDQILIGVTYQNATSATTPDGYTEIASRTSGSTISKLWRRTATGTEPATVNVAFTSAAVAPKSAVSLVYRGVDPQDPIVDVDSGGAGGTSVTIPSLDNNDAANQVVTIGGATSGGVPLDTTWTPPSGQTVREQTSQSVAVAFSAAAAADGPVGEGATNPLTISFGTAADMTGIGVVLKRLPAPQRWYHQDGLGSTRIVTDEGGNVVGKASYDAYGQTTVVSGETTRIGYAGQYTDPDTGLVYLRARYYDPQTSQFLTRDPLLHASQDPYGYAANNPVNLTDPTGLCPACLAGAIIGGGTDLAIQAFGNIAAGCPAFSRINWGEVGMAALAGGLLDGAVAFAALKGVGIGARAANGGVRAARQAYVDSARAVSDDGLTRLAAGEASDVVARSVVAARNALKLETRQKMPRLLNRYAESRNIRRYGNPVGPSYESLISRPGATDFTIVNRAGNTSGWINWILGVQ